VGGAQVNLALGEAAGDVLAGLPLEVDTLPLVSELFAPPISFSSSLTLRPQFNNNCSRMKKIMIEI